MDRSPQPQAKPRSGHSAVHIPVLRAAVLTALELTPGLTVVDATVGAGGHSFDIFDEISPGGTLVGIDRDPMMLQLAAARLQSSPHASTTTCYLEQASYVALPEILPQHQLSGADRVLADLGLSSDQLADAARGFRFDADGPLDLRFDVHTGTSAADIVNRRSAEELARLFREFGEERHADRIARHLVSIRQHRPVVSARDLAEAVAAVVPRSGHAGIHPATRVFQALRIAANEELDHVAQFVNEVLPAVLRPGGRAAIITFHSLEDRLVKNAFRDATVWSVLTKKPLEATAAEKRHNPRSRSAKLRVAVRQ